MNTGRDSAVFRRRPETLRWAICFALALCFHAAGAAALMARWNDNADLVANAPVIMLELAAVAAAPDITPTEVSPGPQQMQAPPETKPQKPIEKIEKVELIPAPQAELQITPPPKPLEKLKEKKPRHTHVSLASAPSAAEHKADRAVAPTPGANSHNPDALRNWHSELIARLERYKRPPPEAPNTSGIASLAFSVDRSGGVHSARIAHSSGSSLLDRETLMLIERAQPMPPPPPEISGSQIPVVVPIRYNMR